MTKSPNTFQELRLLHGDLIDPSKIPHALYPVPISYEELKLLGLKRGELLHPECLAANPSRFDKGHRKAWNIAGVVFALVAVGGIGGCVMNPYSGDAALGFGFFCVILIVGGWVFSGGIFESLEKDRVSPHQSLVMTRLERLFQEVHSHTKALALFEAKKKLQAVTNPGAGVPVALLEAFADARGRILKALKTAMIFYDHPELEQPMDELLLCHTESDFSLSEACNVNESWADAFKIMQQTRTRLSEIEASGQNETRYEVQ